jgi:hypothetical protein
VTCILPLRFIKGALVASQYLNKAEEGRLATTPVPPNRAPSDEV